ncbi:MAG TPA: hypothetical protein VIW94_02215 [Acidimicrobiia bacterium]
MFEMFLVVTAMGAGVDLRVVAIIAMALRFPLLSVSLLMFHLIRSRPGRDTRAATFCQEVAREIRAGESLRAALDGAAQIVAATGISEAIATGDTIEQLLPGLRREFPEVGEELASVVQSVAVSGASAAPLFDELGDLALAQVEIAEEIKVATAPARASAMVLVGLPIVYLGYQVGMGRLQTLTARPIQQGLASIGLALVVVGIGIGFWLVRRAS